MSDTVIRVENLGKKYIIGHQQQERYTALRDVLANKAKGITQRLNPKSKIQNPKFEEFWALKDVSFEVKRGDRIGIIGRNGAGKSTLLKILSRITEPTEGRISIKGRVASLLEVGTGFHPELTGRENIYLNGAILGMSKVDIRRQFDEIVAFAEVEKFLDTPVKRYSSGMYVRLAFAVAAHLEPEILIVDEVLAVGDAAFQKKCLGKMEDVAEKEGRTVLFVSHNMAAISQLCTHAFFLEQGTVTRSNHPNIIIESYLAAGSTITGFWSASNPNTSKEINILEGKLVDRQNKNTPIVAFEDSILIEILYRTNRSPHSWALAVRVSNSSGEHIFTSWDLDGLKTKKNEDGKLYSASCFVPQKTLKPGRYTVSLAAHSLPQINCIEHHENIFGFEVSTVGYCLNHGRWGIITPILDWNMDEK